jgi:hypothetical protein
MKDSGTAQKKRSARLSAGRVSPFHQFDLARYQLARPSSSYNPFEAAALAMRSAPQ